MRYLVAVLFVFGAFAWPSGALADCTTNTIFIGGKVTVCMTCCNYGMCSTNCF